MNEDKLIQQITEEVLARLNKETASGAGAAGAAGAAGSGKDAAGAGASGTADEPVILPKDLAKYIDHTLLKPEATVEQFNTLCDEAKEYGFYSVCVNSSWVRHCAKRLQGSDVKVCAVVGFPLGAMAGRAKNFEARHAVEDGAREIDMVINVGALRSRDLETVESDIRWVRRACGRNVVLKVIIETALLTDEEKILACRIAEKVGVDFVKTSTGFSHHGATVRDVQLMRQSVGKNTSVKAAGGVRSFDDAVAMIRAGATRLGTSSGVKLVRGEATDGAY